MSGFKQTGYDHAYFMPLSSLQGAIYTYTGSSGSGGSATKGSFAPAVWATSLTRYGYTPGATGSGNTYLSSINGIGAGMLKDMGTTVVSSSRTFRKVQLVVPAVGVAGVANLTPAEDYLTGYIEISIDGSAPAGPLARVARVGV
jgi:hypothetical protein